MTINETKNWRIFIVPVISEEIEAKIETIPIEKLLNAAIYLEAYGEGVEKIICNLIVSKSDINLPFLEYKRKHGLIHIGIKVSRNYAQNAPKEILHTLIQHTFLQSILTMKTLEDDSSFHGDFDFYQFYSDVENLFFPLDN